jgi:hypothetical protein
MSIETGVASPGGGELIPTSSTLEPIGGSEVVEIKESIVVDEVFVRGVPVEEAINEFLEIEVEGKKHRWHKETISIVEVANLGGWSAAEGVLHIDPENNERSLGANEVVCVEIGVSFAKKVRFRRG